MKNKTSFLLIALGLFFVSNINAQTNWDTNTPLDPTSSALGDGNSITSIFSSAFGKNNEITGAYSNTFGLYNTVSGSYSYAFGLHSEATKSFSFAAGRYTKASGINSFVFGKGATPTIKLENSKDYSFLVGFKQNEPGLFVSRNNSGPIVGIGTDDPQSRLDVRLADRQEIIVQSEVPNTYGGFLFNHSDGSANWRIRAYSNFAGGYGNILGIQSAGGKGELWIAAKKTMIGDFFDFDDCTDCDDYKLFVKKGIRTEKVKVDLASGVWADYVFQKGYNLKSLEEVEAFINTNGHLPNIPSATEIETEGLNLGEMDAKLLEKIEELTLYVISLKKEINELKTEK